MNDFRLTTLFALARAVHFGACLLLLGVPFFDRLIVAPLPRTLRDTVDRGWKPIALILALFAAAGALVSGIAWMGFVAIEMSGLPPREALRSQTLNLVWSQTHFGTLWKLRTIFWVAAAALSIFAFTRIVSAARGANRLRATASWLAMLVGILFVASLAWAGHGQTGPRVAIHLPADVLHLLIAALWPVGLLPFVLVLLRLRNSPYPLAGESIVAITRRFSAASLIGVALLMSSGIINSWSLVGPIANFWRTHYGRLLSLKILLFLLMVLIGAQNLLHWKPRLAINRGEESYQRSARKLQRNVTIELILAVAVMLVVGYLGIAMPPFHEHHEHLHSAELPAAQTPGRSPVMVSRLSPSGRPPGLK